MASAFSTYPSRASLEGLESEIFELVSRNATPKQWAEWLRAPLEHAAAEGNLDLVDKLIGAGATVIAGWKGCDGRTLLHAAAVGGNEGVLSSLLRAGAQPDVNTVSPPPFRRSPLYMATEHGHEAVARLLIIAGADVNFNDPHDNCSVLHEAISGGYEQLVKELVIGGANVKARDSYNATPLHIAAKHGFNRIVVALLLRGVDVDAVDVDGGSALMWASGANEGGPHLDVVETLLAAGADSSIRATQGSQYYAALDYAANKGHVAVIQAIVRSGANVNSRDDADGHAALHWAAAADQAGSVDALIEAGSDIELKSNDGLTPLAAAASDGKANALLALLQQGASVNARNNEAMTPLHRVCFFQSGGLEAVVDLLLRWDADETALDQDGKTPEELLNVEHNNNRECSQEEVERVRLLLAHAAADKAWRRRCWLFMLRSRAWKARYASCDGGSEGSEDSNLSDRPTGERRQRARSDGAAGIARGGGGQSIDGSGGRFRAETKMLSSVVASLVGLPEGVFRKIVSYL